MQYTLHVLESILPLMQRIVPETSINLLQYRVKLFTSLLRFITVYDVACSELSAHISARQHNDLRCAGEPLATL